MKLIFLPPLSVTFPFELGCHFFVLTDVKIVCVLRWVYVHMQTLVLYLFVYNMGVITSKGCDFENNLETTYSLKSATSLLITWPMLATIFGVFCFHEEVTCGSFLDLSRHSMWLVCVSFSAISLVKKNWRNGNEIILFEIFFSFILVMIPQLLIIFKVQANL